MLTCAYCGLPNPPEAEGETVPSKKLISLSSALFCEALVRRTLKERLEHVKAVTVNVHVAEIRQALQTLTATAAVAVQGAVRGAVDVGLVMSCVSSCRGGYGVRDPTLIRQSEGLSTSNRV